MAKEVVKVIKNKITGDIKTWMSHQEIGASVDLEGFIRGVCLKYGNPTLTFTVDGLVNGMIEATREQIQELKNATAVVVVSQLGKEG